MTAATGNYGGKVGRAHSISEREFTERNAADVPEPDECFEGPECYVRTAKRSRTAEYTLQRRCVALQDAQSFSSKAFRIQRPILDCWDDTIQGEIAA